MNALLIALTMSLAGTEGTIDAPSSLAADLAPFPLQMSFFGAEETAQVDHVDLRPSSCTTLCVAFELPAYAELAGMEKGALPLASDSRPTLSFMTAAPVSSPDTCLGWLKDWSRR